MATNRGRPTSTCTSVNADGTGAAKNLTAANPAWDTGPVFAKDGKTLYYRAMKRPGFEADRFALMAMDLATGKSREIAPNWDFSANGIALSDDGKSIYTTAESVGQAPLFSVDIASGEAKTLVADGTVTSARVRRPDAGVHAQLAAIGRPVVRRAARWHHARARSRRAPVKCCRT
jgi:dipeptidyl aminopeptidase/acylaminoacyl peptidase